MHLLKEVRIAEHALALSRKYIEAGVLPERWTPDALHVALATINECGGIVSWNFKHIVNFRRIPQYDAVNIANGYGPIAIHTPPEVLPMKMNRA